MGFFKNIKLSIDDKSSMSVNSITLLISAGIAAIIGLVVCFVLIWDVIANGYIKTDLLDLGIFLMSSGAYVMGSGMPKTIVDSRLRSRSWAESERLEEGMRMHRRVHMGDRYNDDAEYAEDVESSEEDVVKQ